MTDAGDRGILVKVVLGDANEVLVIADVFRRAATAEEDTKILFRLDVLECNVGRHGVTFPFLGDGPAGFHLVHDHLVFALLGCGEDGLVTAFDQAEIGIHGVHRLGGVANDDEYFVFHCGSVR